MFRDFIRGACWLGAAAVAMSLPHVADAQPAARRVEPTAKFAVAQWQYEFALKAWGTRSEGEWGTLTYEDKQVDAESIPGLAVDDYVHTPWGTLYWSGISKYIWGGHGWFPTPMKGKPGKRVVPANAPGDVCVLMEADDGSTVRVAQHTRILVLLAQRQAFERPWSLQESAGLPAVGMASGKRSPLPRGWGPGSFVQYAFNADQPGTNVLTFAHKAESPAPARKIRITVVVAASAPPSPAKSVEVSLSFKTPKATVTAQPDGTIKVHVSLSTGTGYQLKLAPPPAKAAVLQGDPIVEAPTSKLIGAPSIHHYEFRIGTTPPAEFRILFQLRRPGQTTGPDYEVTVKT